MTAKTRQPIAPVAIVKAPLTPAPMPPIARPSLAPLTLSAARIAEATAPRVATDITELDRVLGGGLVDGSFVLVGGDPGAGKSTLLLQAIDRLCRTERDSALYATGEESAQQVALRAQRIGIENERVHVVASDDLDEILALAARISPTVLVIDSLQAVQTRECDSDVGTPAQVAQVAHRLARFTKDTNTPVIAIGQVTKDGAIAGPKTLEHLVDVVLYIESAGGSRRRLVSSKNRLGSTDEVGIFEMREHGMISCEMTSSTLAERAIGAPGSAVFPAMIGERVQLCEIQALVGGVRESGKGQLSVSGVDQKRVAMIVAILAKHALIDVSERDVFVSATAGMRASEPAADLAIALAIASSARDLPIAERCAVFGELGLAGEVRGVAFARSRADEARRGGFVEPLAAAADASDTGAASAKTLADAIEMVIGEAVRS